MKNSAVSFIKMMYILLMKQFILIAILIFSITGCGSDINNDGNMVRKIIDGFDGEPVVPRNANRLYIVPPANTTVRDDMSPKLFNKVREYISIDGRLGVDADDNNSDLRLEIWITRYLIEGMKFDAIGRAIEKRMWITADVRLLNIKRKKLIFYEANIQSFKSFSELVSPIETETQVLDYVLDDLAKRITAKTVTGWYTDQMTIIEKRKL
jgi:hypothetical protein